MTELPYCKTDKPGEEGSILPGHWSYWIWGPREKRQVVAVICCPLCRRISTASPTKHKIAADGKVSPSYVCPFKPCTWHVFIRLKDWHPESRDV